MNETILYCTGGFTAGCVVGLLGAKAFLKRIGFLNRENDVPMITKDSKSILEPGANQFSNMTLLLGTPTPSGIILDTREYPLYSASENYPDIDRNNRSLMARYLTLQLYEELRRRSTSSGFDIDSCIQTGVDNPDKMSCGIVAGDEECYDVFAEIFDPVISDRHRGFIRGAKPHETNLSAENIHTKAFDPIYVKSTHILIGRCVRGFRFPPRCSRAERKHVENLLKVTLESLSGDFDGTYMHLSDMSGEDRRQLPDILQSISEKPTSPTLQHAGSTRDWPHGRGVFYNNQGTLFAWTNREDHLRIMYRDRKLNFVQSFKEFCTAMKELETHMKENGLEFVFHNDYGYLLSCPSGVGTALRAGVHMKLPNLIRDQRFKTILKNLRLNMGSEDQETLKKGYLDVYNMDRLGHTESDLVQHVADAVHTLTEMERRLEKNASISDLIGAK